MALAAFFCFFWLRLTTVSLQENKHRLRILWTSAVALYLFHMITAFWFFHGWSHEAAVEHTAQRTFEFTGLRWGGGIYFNHAFTILCCLELLAWWLVPQLILNRSRWMNFVIYGYFLVIIFNAAIVFVSGQLRWISAIAFFVLGVAGLARILRNRHEKA